jgi:hypothetical protein
MTRAELRFLEREPDIRPGLQGRAHGIGLMADHDHDRRRGNPSGRAKHVLD